MDKTIVRRLRLELTRGVLIHIRNKNFFLLLRAHTGDSLMMTKQASPTIDPIKKTVIFKIPLCKAKRYIEKILLTFRLLQVMAD
jgi:hypothetical protein